MTNAKIIDSSRARVIERDGRWLAVHISRAETDDKWSLWVVARNGSLTVWDEMFTSDEGALYEALKTIEEDGITSFCLSPSAPAVH